MCFVVCKCKFQIVGHVMIYPLLSETHQGFFWGKILSNHGILFFFKSQIDPKNKSVLEVSGNQISRKS